MPIRRSKRSSVEQRSQRKAKIVAVFVTRITIFAQQTGNGAVGQVNFRLRVILHEVKGPPPGLGPFKLDRVNRAAGEVPRFVWDDIRWC
jgi:hypothetical protein